MGAIWSSGKYLIVKIQNRCQRISNILLPGWRACKNWFFMLTTFLAPGIFSIYDIRKKIKKWPEPNIFLYPKINYAMSVNHAKEFLKYVLYFQNWNTGGHLKLWQKSVEIQNILEKFLCMVDAHDITDFWIFGSGDFLIFFQISWIEKMPRAKKVVNIKNQFLHARQLREGIFDICSNWCCIFTISC